MRSRVQPLAIGAMAFGALVDARAIGMSLNPRYLGKRSITGISCGGFSTADIGDSQENISNLNNKGGTATAPANGCSRVGCYNTRCVALGGITCGPEALTIFVAACTFATTRV